MEGYADVAGLNRGALIDELLPPEIFDAIFDLIRHQNAPDKNALFGCSLVSRAWRAMTLRHRFHTLSFYARVGERTSLTGIPSERKLFLQDFVNCDVYPLVRSAVHTLRLKWIMGPGVSLDFAQLSIDFPALRELVVHGRLTEAISNGARRVKFPPLDLLAVHGTSASGPGYPSKNRVSSLCDLLCQFTAVRELRLVNIHEWDYCCDTNLEGKMFPRISSLVLEHIPTHPSIADVIKRLAIESSSPLKHVDILPFTGDELAAMLDIIRSFPTSPEHISFTITCWGAHEASIPRAGSIDLGSLPALKRLTVAIELIHDYAPNPVGAHALTIGPQINAAAWRQVAAVLSTLDAACRLEAVDLWIAAAETDTSELFLPAMERALQDARETGVQVLENVLVTMVREGRLEYVRALLYRAPPTEDGLVPRFYCPSADLLEAVLPRLHALSALRV